MQVADVETRDAPAEQDGGLIKGYAATFMDRALIGGEFFEQIAPGAFANTIRNGDVLALIAHDYGRVLGRQSAGTLRLRENGLGLYFELDADLTTPSGQEAFGNIKRRNIKGCSFGFRVLSENWTDDGDVPLRTILEIQLYEVSVLANPAYETTAAWVSSRAKNNNTAARRRIEAAQRRRGILR
ncbi:HK97 family phage prohead protease [Bradyrhizobium pachyrhizi]|uniref:HK97 family phage prohead protease n=1 Tax=Bradyrhizobium pachyrhizi TaxID=280333 RepID=UPI003D360B03